MSLMVGKRRSWGMPSPQRNVRKLRERRSPRRFPSSGPAYLVYAIPFQAWTLPTTTAFSFTALAGNALPDIFSTAR
jgi:hypothetical protein